MVHAKKSPAPELALNPGSGEHAIDTCQQGPV